MNSANCATCPHFRQLLRIYPLGWLTEVFTLLGVMKGDRYLIPSEQERIGRNHDQVTEMINNVIILQLNRFYKIIEEILTLSARMLEIRRLRVLEQVTTCQAARP